MAELLKPMEPYFDSMAGARATAWGPRGRAAAAGGQRHAAGHGSLRRPGRADRRRGRNRPQRAGDKPSSSRSSRPRRRSWPTRISQPGARRPSSKRSATASKSWKTSTPRPPPRWQGFAAHQNDLLQPAKIGYRHSVPGIPPASRSRRTTTVAQPAAKLRVHSTSYIIIPARLGSTRLPGKLLLRETGKSVIQHTYRGGPASHAARRRLRGHRPRGHLRRGPILRRLGGDDRARCRRAGPIAWPRSPGGSADVDIVVNVQGDEPELSGEAIDLAVGLLEENPEAVMATLATPDPQPPPIGRPGLREGGLRRARPGDVLQPQPDPPCPAMGRRTARRRSAPLLSAHRSLRLPPRFPARSGQDATVEPRTGREARTTPRPPGRPRDSGRHVDEPTIGIDTPDDYRAFVERHRPDAV